MKRGRPPQDWDIHVRRCAVLRADGETDAYIRRALALPDEVAFNKVRAKSDDYLRSELRCTLPADEVQQIKGGIYERDATELSEKLREHADQLSVDGTSLLEVRKFKTEPR